MRAAPGELVGTRDASGGGSDCREYRCLEPDEYREDLKENSEFVSHTHRKLQ